METPNTVESWVKEIYKFYNISLADHVDLYREDKALFFYRQHKFAPDYAIFARTASIEVQEIESIKAQVFHWFASLPDKYDDAANEKDFAFAFCYLFTNHLLQTINKEMAWKVLSYITHHWDEGDALIEIPEEVWQ